MHLRPLEISAGRRQTSRCPRGSRTRVRKMGVARCAEAAQTDLRTEPAEYLEPPTTYYGAEHRGSIMCRVLPNFLSVLLASPFHRSEPPPGFGRNGSRNESIPTFNDNQRGPGPTPSRCARRLVAATDFGRRSVGESANSYTRVSSASAQPGPD